LDNHYLCDSEYLSEYLLNDDPLSFEEVKVKMIEQHLENPDLCSVLEADKLTLKVKEPVTASGCSKILSLICKSKKP
jgi:hypothetical protein